MFLTFKATEEWEIEQYQPSSARGTRSPPAMRHRLQAPKWLKGGPKWLQFFFIRALLLWEKFAMEGKKGGGETGVKGKKWRFYWPLKSLPVDCPILKRRPLVPKLVTCWVYKKHAWNLCGSCVSYKKPQLLHKFCACFLFAPVLGTVPGNNNDKLGARMTNWD